MGRGISVYWGGGEEEQIQRRFLNNHNDGLMHPAPPPPHQFHQGPPNQQQRVNPIGPPYPQNGYNAHSDQQHVGHGAIGPPPDASEGLVAPRVSPTTSGEAAGSALLRLLRGGSMAEAPSVSRGNESASVNPTNLHGSHPQQWHHLTNNAEVLRQQQMGQIERERQMHRQHGSEDVAGPNQRPYPDHVTGAPYGLPHDHSDQQQPRGDPSSFMAHPHDPTRFARGQEMAGFGRPGPGQMAPWPEGAYRYAPQGEMMPPPSQPVGYQHDFPRDAPLYSGPGGNDGAGGRPPLFDAGLEPSQGGMGPPPSGFSQQAFQQIFRAVYEAHSSEPEQHTHMGSDMQRGEHGRASSLSGVARRDEPRLPSSILGSDGDDGTIEDTFTFEGMGEAVRGIENTGMKGGEQNELATDRPRSLSAGESQLENGERTRARGEGGRPPPRGGQNRARQRNLQRDRLRLDAGVLTEQLMQIVGSLTPEQAEVDEKLEIGERLQQVARSVFPGCTLSPFGSAASGFGLRGSDIDFCLTVALDMKLGEKLAKAEIVEILAEKLDELGYLEVTPLPKARVPIVKLRDHITKTQCDICVNNHLALANTRLLKTYSMIDKRLTALVYCIKHWAKCRQVNQTYAGTLSSYAYVIMCIHLLQTRDPPILPCLQSMQPITYSATIEGWHCEYFDDVDKLRRGETNRENLGQLLYAFFDYWAWRHEYTAKVITIRTSQYVVPAGASGPPPQPHPRTLDVNTIKDGNLFGNARVASCHTGL